MNLSSSIRNILASSAIVAGAIASAQTPAAPAAPAAAPQAAAPAADAAPAVKPWRVGPMDVSGFADGNFTWNDNHPTSANNGQSNDLYNFNDQANQPSLDAAKLTLNHDPGKIGARVDLMFGRTNHFINPVGQLEYVEQAYISTKPPKAKGFELDLGKWVTSAGAEVIEAKDNWNYTRSLLFAWAIPYWHFGVRTSMPVSKTETLGVQIVNGWNNITQSTGGVTAGITSALAKPKYTWSANVYTGPENTPGQNAYRNLFDTTLLLTPNTKFNMYVNYDYGHNGDSLDHGLGNKVASHWQGVAFAAHDQITSTVAGAARFEVFNDAQGYATGMAQTLKEFTGTYEYHFKGPLLSRAEFRKDWSEQQFFHRGAAGMTDSQTTISIGIIAIFAAGQ